MAPGQGYEWHLSLPFCEGHGDATSAGTTLLHVLGGVFLTYHELDDARVQEADGKEYEYML